MFSPLGLRKCTRKINFWSQRTLTVNPPQVPTLGAKLSVRSEEGGQRLRWCPIQLDNRPTSHRSRAVPEATGPREVSSVSLVMVAPDMPGGEARPQQPRGQPPGRPAEHAARGDGRRGRDLDGVCSAGVGIHQSARAAPRSRSCRGALSAPCCLLLTPPGTHFGVGTAGRNGLRTYSINSAQSRGVRTDLAPRRSRGLASGHLPRHRAAPHTHQLMSYFLNGEGALKEKLKSRKLQNEVL